MSNTLVADVEEFIEQHYGNEFWFELDYQPERYPVTINGEVFTPVLVEDFGGEGQGDERWVVFSLGERMFRKSGYYASYDGTTWDGSFEEVEPRQVYVTQYFAVNK